MQVQLDRRRPGQKGAGSIGTARNEADAVQILSGVAPRHPTEECCVREFLDFGALGLRAKRLEQDGAC